MYKPALSKSNPSWDNSYYVRLVKVCLAVNIGKFKSLVNEDNFFVEFIAISTAIFCYAML